jgi:predicted AAA+ superfamily ATPase
MVGRPFWHERFTTAWRQVPIVWLAGPRRVGKTVLARQLESARFLNCDLPSVAERLADPESFYRTVTEPVVVFDEIHQLADPSRLLKIAADAYPRLKILATGSSTLAATRKFRDSLAGRKRVVHLVPVLYQELPAFGVTDLRQRLLRGGLPSVLLGEEDPHEFFREWLDSYFARDVQELFHVEKRTGFLLVLELLLHQSGGLLDISRIARDSAISRPTVMSWLEVFQITRAIHVVRPYAGGRREILAQPKAYGFDTGLVCHVRGWDDLRPDDCGGLWEHLVLDALDGAGETTVHYWRDKQQREIDFVVPRGRQAVDTVECKWNPKSFEPKALLAFRERYPKGRNLVVCPIEGKPYQRTVSSLEVTFLSPTELVNVG